MHACVTLQAQAMVRCKGITKARNQCSVTSSSSWVDDNGRLVAAPLCRGRDFCALHAKPFCVKPLLLDNFERMVVFILGSETLGSQHRERSGSGDCRHTSTWGCAGEF